jgi:hypothetical protein
MLETITTAIVAAIAAGAVDGVTDTAKQAIGDAYGALKALLGRAFGGGSDVVAAIDQLEKNPNSEGRKQIVAEELANAKADANPELVAAAEQVLAKLQELPHGERQHIMQAVGSYIAQADRGSTAKVTVTGKP